MRALVVAALVLASSTAAVADKLPTVPATYIEDQLAQQVQRMIDAGHLAPGLAYVADHYCFDAWPDGKSGSYYQFDDYWHNPAETIYTLALAIPYLPASMQQAAKAYLQSEFSLFPPHTYMHMGPGGARRELSGLPPSFTLSFPSFSFNPATYYEDYWITGSPRQNSESMPGWEFNPFNFYASWKYAEVFPGQAQAVFAQVKNKVKPLPADDAYLQQRPHVLNQHIAGYFGYLALQKMAGESPSTTVQGYLDGALQKRLAHLNAVNPVTLDGWEQGGFLYMVPELADHLRANALPRVQEVFTYWDWAQPYWHVPAAGESFKHLDTESINGFVEGATQDVYGHWAMFQAAAHALKWNRAQLEKYLHGAAVHRGDLYYIQNLVATLRAGGVPPVAPVLVAPAVPLVVGGTNALTGTGFTPGTVVKLFVATAEGAVAHGPYTPVTWSTTSLSWAIPPSVPLGNGFGSVQVVNTDQGYTESNVVSALLEGDPNDNIPTILYLNGDALAPPDSSVAIAHVDTVVAKGSTVTITGTGFNTPGVNLFTASGNVGPLWPSAGGTQTTIQVVVPPTSSTGPGNFQVVNTPYTGNVASNAVSAVIGARPTITGVSVVGATATVTGSGFCSLSVINLFNLQGAAVVNLGGLNGTTPRIPLALASDTQFAFALPAGAVAGPAYVEVLNPPYIPFASSGDDPDGAFTIP